MVNYLIKDNGLVVYVNKKSYTIRSDHTNYVAVKQLLIKDGDKADPQKLEELLDVQKSFENFVSQGEGIVVENGNVFYKGAPLHNSLTSRILKMQKEGFDIQPMVHFLENLMENPSYRSVNQLYDFMEKNDLPITPDGHFLAYKKVVRIDGVLKDIYTRTIVNEPGSVVEVARNQVDEDPTRTCSHGLHYCSREYLPHFGTGPGTTVVVVKVNPADVVAIPDDYNNAKVRGCRYEVVEIVEEYENNFKYSVQSRSYEELKTESGVQHEEDEYEFGYSAGAEKAERHNNNAKGQTIAFGVSDKSDSFNSGYWDGYWDFRYEDFAEESDTEPQTPVTQMPVRSVHTYNRDSSGRFVSNTQPSRSTKNYRRDRYGRFTSS